MSTEFGKIEDALNEKESIEVALGTGGIRSVSTQKKIWLTSDNAEKLRELLYEAILFNDRL